MTITNRNLAVGTKLTAKYMKVVYHAEVVQTEEGVRFQLEDGRQFTSISAAGIAIRGGKSTNGWAFWSVEGEGKEAVAALPKVPKAKNGKGIIRKATNQKGTPEGETRWFCSACADSFFVSAGETPTACPVGHAWGPGHLVRHIDNVEPETSAAGELERIAAL